MSARQFTNIEFLTKGAKVTCKIAFTYLELWCGMNLDPGRRMHCSIQVLDKIIKQRNIP